MTHPTSTGRQWTIRPALPADAPVLVAFTLREASDAEGRSLPVVDVERGVAAAFADPPKARYWVAEAGGLLLGSVSAVTEWSNVLGGDYWWVQSLYVLPEGRGSGLADALLDRLAHEAAAAGALDLRLLVHETNARAQRVYDRAGFTRAPYAVLIRAT